MEGTNFSLSESKVVQTAADQKELIALIKRQNELLESLQKNLVHSMREEDDRHNTVVTRILDINMSIGSMISFMLKWLVASIPVGIILGLVWLVFTLLFGGLLYGLGR